MLMTKREPLAASQRGVARNIILPGRGFQDLFDFQIRGFGFIACCTAF